MKTVPKKIAVTVVGAVRTVRSSGRPRTKHPGRKPKYPWEKWFAADEPITLTKGVDFKIRTPTMAQMIRSWCYKRGYKVSIHYLSDTSLEVRVCRPMA